MTHRIAFAGTPEFAATVLGTLAPQVSLVLSQPARPKGRGLAVTPSPVESLARSLEIPVRTPEKLTAEDLEGIDLLVTAAYGVILPRDVLARPKFGALNVHGSLLPKWRGAAPVQRAIEAGDDISGISIFRIEESLDSGPVISTKSVRIDAHETAGEFLERLAVIAASMLPDVVRDYLSGRLVPVPQNHSEATHARKIKKEEGRLAWTTDVESLYRRYRAFTPWPGISVDGLKLLSVRPIERSGSPGLVLSLDPLIVGVAGGSVRLDRVQESGGRAVSGADFARGKRLAVGDRL